VARDGVTAVPATTRMIALQALIDQAMQALDAAGKPAA
jgi:hypothetical protein